MRLYCSIFCLLCIVVAQAQQFQIPDSLASWSYEKLLKECRERRIKEDTLSRLYARAYIQKARNEDNRLENAIGYSHLGGSYSAKEPDKALKYYDSAIAISKSLHHKRYPALFYLYKSAVYEKKGDFKEALKYYLIAGQWCKRFENDHLGHVVKHNIGMLKLKIGKFEESKRLFKECLSYRIGKQERMTIKDTMCYLSTLSALVNTYILNTQIDSANIINKKGLLAAQGKDIANSFKLNRALLQYYDKNYKSVIQDTNELLPELLKPKNRFYFITTDLANIYLYQGKSYEELDNMKMAIVNYNRIDSVLQDINYIIPQIRTAYSSLIHHYKKIGDKEKQLIYIDKLLRSDSILDKNYKEVGDKLIREYDTPNLLQEKEALIAALEDDQKQSLSRLGWMSLFLVLSLSGAGYYFYKQQRYKKRFLQLVDQQKETKPKEQLPSKHKTSIAVISNEARDHLLAQLQNFEDTQGYLASKINAKDLAKSFGSNSSYLSIVVNTYKQKRVSQYINDLRIDYAVARLQKDPKFRKYTIKAIAQDTGFNTAESFAKSFYKNTGIYPSYFIKQLENTQ